MIESYKLKQFKLILQELDQNPLDSTHIHLNLEKYLPPKLTQEYYFYQMEIEKNLNCPIPFKIQNKRYLSNFLQWVRENVLYGTLLIYFERPFKQIFWLYEFIQREKNREKR